MKPREELPSITIEVNTPDGVLYYTICEKDDYPTKVISTFGKSGSALAAWAQAVDVLVNMLLEKKTSINDIIDNLSNITNNKPMRTNSGVRVGSGPEGIVIAFLEYKRQRMYRRNNAITI